MRKYSKIFFCLSVYLVIVTFLLSYDAYAQKNDVTIYFAEDKYDIDETVYDNKKALQYEME